MFSIHQDGWRFIGIFFAASLFFFMISIPLGIIAMVLTGWCIYFFRNPVRIIPKNENAIISPADGKIVLIEEVIPPAKWSMGSEKRTRISIFLNVFNVHVNRVPIKGKISDSFYEPGKFFNASLDKASLDNERNSIIIEPDALENNEANKIACVQIAGLIARRIRCDVKKDENVNAGDVYGIIRFGSRVDVYLPKDIKPQVLLGQTTIAGETILAVF